MMMCASRKHNSSFLMLCTCPKILTLFLLTLVYPTLRLYSSIYLSWCIWYLPGPFIESAVIKSPIGLHE